MNLRGDARGGHHSRVRAPGSSDGRAEDAPEGSDPRRRPALAETRRERLRRALLRFGLGRWRAVHEASRVEGRAALDVRLACFDFARAVAERARDAHVKTYLAARLADAPRASRESPSPRDRKPLRPNASTELRLFGPDPLVGPWSKVPRNADAWARRLRLLDAVNAAAEKCVAEETREEALALIARAFHSDDADADGAELPMTRTRTEPGGSDAADDDAASRLPPWWSPECDAALLFGIRRHGFGAYDETRRDAWCEPVFAEAASANGGEEARAAFRRAGERAESGDHAHQDATDAGGVQDDDEKSSKSEDDEESSKSATTTKSLQSPTTTTKSLQSLTTTASLQSPTTRTVVVVLRPEKAGAGRRSRTRTPSLGRRGRTTLTARVKRLAARLSAPGACVASDPPWVGALLGRPRKRPRRADPFAPSAANEAEAKKSRAKRRREEKRRRLGLVADAMLRGRWEEAVDLQRAADEELEDANSCREERARLEALDEADEANEANEAKPPSEPPSEPRGADPSPDPSPSFLKGEPPARSSARSSRKLAAAKARVDARPPKLRWSKKDLRALVATLLDIGVPWSRERGCEWVALATRAGVAPEKCSRDAARDAFDAVVTEIALVMDLTDGKPLVKTRAPADEHKPECRCAVCRIRRAKEKGADAVDEARSETKDEDEDEGPRTKDEDSDEDSDVNEDVNEDENDSDAAADDSDDSDDDDAFTMRPSAAAAETETGTETEREGVSARAPAAANANASSRPSRSATYPFGLLSHVAAARVRDRLDTFHALRHAQALAGPGGVASLPLPPIVGKALPSWWTAGMHDRALVAGAARHGFEGGTLRGVASDPGLPFAERPEGDSSRRGGSARTSSASSRGSGGEAS